MKYVYFIAWTAVKPSGITVVGSTESTLSVKLTGMDYIRQVEKSIKGDYYKGVTITNFILLRTEQYTLDT